MTDIRKARAEDQELVALFEGLDTPGVSDAMDKLGLHGQALGIMPLANYPKAVVGSAFTVKYVPANDPPGTVGDFIDDVAPGDVVVIDNDGRTDCTVWGDIMTQYAGLRGIAATVIDGVCRDVNKALGDILAESPMPTRRGKVLKVYYLSQTGTRPPAFALFVNEPKWLHFSTQRRTHAAHPAQPPGHHQWRRYNPSTFFSECQHVRFPRDR